MQQPAEAVANSQLITLESGSFYYNTTIEANNCSARTLEIMVKWENTSNKILYDLFWKPRRCFVASWILQKTKQLAIHDMNIHS